MRGVDSKAAVRAIVQRSDLDELTEGILDSFWHRPEYQSYAPDREQVRRWVRWNVDLVVAWLVDDRQPTEQDRERFRERARLLAEDGMPADIVPANFRRGARHGWAALVDAARDHERTALLESAGLFFEFVDQVSEQFSAAYARSRAADPSSQEEHRARALLSALCSPGELDEEGRLLAEQIGFSPSMSHHLLVAIDPDASARVHAGLAADLRADGTLAVFEGRRVVGVAHVRPRADVALGPRAVVVEAHGVARALTAVLLEQLRATARLAARRGRTGRIPVDDFLAELLVMADPALSARLSAQVYGRLSAEPELIRTLDALVEHDFGRTATAAELFVHRNTLTNRLSRIAAITGQQVDTAAGRGLIWLAWLHREVGAATRRAPRGDQAAAPGPLATRPRPAAASGRFQRSSYSA